MNIGWERKIGYSFVGLLAGNVASVAVLLMLTVLAHFDAFGVDGIRGGFGLSCVIGIVSILCWVVLGLPVVLSLPTRIIARIHPIISGGIGVVLGLSAILLFCMAMNGGRLNTELFSELRDVRTAPFFADAALIAGVAFAVYCALVKQALRRQAKENGAPRGTPRSLAWFDF